MKKFIYTLSFALSALLFTGCGGESPQEVANDTPDEPICFYSYNPESTVMEWTAFKFNDKTPVKGTFTEIIIGGTTEGDDAMAILNSLTFDIPVASIESQNEDRNMKIIKHFFGTIGTENMTGKVVKLADNGEAILEVTMNKISKEVKGKYTFVDNVFDFSATIDVANWNANSGIEALNKICKDLHTGPDGVSKLWSTVDLTFNTTLKADCN